MRPLFSKCTMIFSKLTLYVSALAIMFGATACGGDDDGSGNGTPSQPAGSVSVPVQALEFEAEGGTASFTVSAPGEWDAAADQAWVSLRKEGTLGKQGSVSVTVAANSSRSARSASIVVMCGSDRAYVTVNQQGQAPEPVDPTIEVPDGYELVWHDEFDGTELNRSDWTHEVQGPGWVNNERQTYVSGVFDGRPVTEVSDGSLKINCFKHSNGNVYSGRIYAQVNSGWTYGIFEARLRLPKGKGTWPAFWMMPVNNNFATNPWPLCGEIDIMEEVGYNPNFTSSSIHCDAYNHVKGTQKTRERYTSGAQDDFHVYRLEWSASGIRTFVDDNPLLDFPNDGKGNVSTWPFNRPFYLILNLAWGGDWGGAQGLDESCLPATMEVDYVRVFQPKL